MQTFTLVAYYGRVIVTRHIKKANFVRIFSKQQLADYACQHSPVLVLRYLGEKSRYTIHLQEI